MFQDLNNSDIPGSTLERALRHRDAFRFAVLAAFGLSLNDAGRHLVGAAKHGANAQDASGSGRKVVRVAQKYKGGTI